MTLSILLVAMLAHLFIVAASYSIWSSITIDEVTAGEVFIEVAPAYASMTGQVNVTVTIYNVPNLYGWQIGFQSSAVVNTTASIIPTDNIFQNEATVGLLVGTTSRGVALMNCLLGESNGVSGDGVLVQVAFDVDWLPASFQIDPQNSILVNADMQDIPFTYAGG